MSEAPLVQPRHLKNAPIIEAVIDVRFSTEVFIADEVRALAQTLTRYKKVEPIRGYEGEVHAFGDGSLEQRSRSLGIRGFKLTAEDEGTLVQLRINGFTFSRLRPYPSWESIQREASEVWRLFRGSIGDLSISRLAVRYINNFQVPRGTVRSRLTFTPEVPAGIKDDQVRSSLLKMIIGSGESLESTVILALEDRPEHGHVVILLDIDTYQSQDGDTMTELELWKKFELLRAEKNRLFFSSITEATAKEFA